MVNICHDLTAALKEEMIEFLLEFKNIFAWSYEEIPGLDTDALMHSLLLKPDCEPVK